MLAETDAFERQLPKTCDRHVNYRREKRVHIGVCKSEKVHPHWTILYRYISRYYNTSSVNGRSTPASELREYLREVFANPLGTLEEAADDSVGADNDHLDAGICAIHAICVALAVSEHPTLTLELHVGVGTGRREYHDDARRVLRASSQNRRLHVARERTVKHKHCVACSGEDVEEPATRARLRIHQARRVGTPVARVDAVGVPGPVRTPGLGNRALERAPARVELVADDRAPAVVHAQLEHFLRAFRQARAPAREVRRVGSQELGGDVEHFLDDRQALLVVGVEERRWREPLAHEPKLPAQVHLSLPL